MAQSLLEVQSFDVFLVDSYGSLILGSKGIGRKMNLGLHYVIGVLGQLRRPGILFLKSSSL